MTLSKMGIYETRHKCHSVLQNCYYAGCGYAECRVLFVMLSVVMLNVVMLNVVAPSEAQVIFLAKPTMVNVPKPYILTLLAIVKDIMF